MNYRLYDKKQDLDAVIRIYREVGWIEQSNQDQAAGVEYFLDAGQAYVADTNNEPECMVLTHMAKLRYQNEDLPLSVVSAVMTSRIARRQKVATRLTAQAMAVDVIENDAAVATLGMFEQGFYDRLGFGTGIYTKFAAFDPANLKIDIEPRVPIRLTSDDWERVHTNRLNRKLHHGSCSIMASGFTRAYMMHGTNRFGLGYADPQTGELTHHLWCIPEKVVNGPYRIRWLVYQSREQFLELMALLKSLGDQVNLVQLIIPAGIQIQDLELKPFVRRRISYKTDFETGTRAFAIWQMRICNIPACLEQTKLPVSDCLTFNLKLSDPVSRHLDDKISQKWNGVAGIYRVTLGADSHAESITRVDASIPTLETSVNTFTRMWLGVQPPTGLAYTVNDLTVSSEELLDKLDYVLRLPEPQPDWDF